MPAISSVFRAGIAGALGASMALSLGAFGEAPPSFALGADLSMLEPMEKQGVVFKEASGKTRDAMALFLEHGWTWFRIRLFVKPASEGGAIQDLPFALRYGRRVKNAGGKLLLDLHYSDTWADPGRQETPAAWRTLPEAEMEKTVEAYTRGVLRAFASNDSVPDMVQVGNEITPGMLWPTGRNDSREGWERFCRYLKAAIRGVDPGPNFAKPAIMIHIDKGGKAETVGWFYDELEAAKVSWDVMGLSFYPWWHGTLSALEKTLALAATRYRKPIVVVETAYPWSEPERFSKENEKRNLEFPITPEGQAAYWKAVVALVRQAPHGLGRGVFAWEPAWIRTKWYGGANAFFDREGKALPILSGTPGIMDR